MADLSGITAADFEPLAGSSFDLAGADGDGSPVALRLVSVERQAGASVGREPFSLNFEGPRTTLLAQGVHCLAHEGLGQVELFLVPVGATETTYQYEAVFS